MKRISLILFSVFYLASSSGLALNFHYCGGKLKSIGINQYAEESCCGKKMKKEGCCDNKTTIVKAFDHHASGLHHAIAKPITPLQQLGVTNQVIYNNPILEILSIIRVKAPPNFSDIPAFLSHRSIRI